MDYHKMEQNGDTHQPPREAMLAWQQIENKGIRYRNRKNGNTILHEAVEASPTTVFICAKAGVHINAQNFDGDSALHLAVRARNTTITRALLMCGADSTLRNKLGQSSLEEAEGCVKDLLLQFKSGLVSAVTKADQSAIIRLTKLWINPHAKIKDGKSALEILKPRIASDPGACTCNTYIQENLATLELVHAVLAEDKDTVAEILQSKRSWNSNVRFRDKKGMTPLYCAVKQDNLEICQLLIEKGNSNPNVLVRETEDDQATIPIYFRTLDTLCSEDLWRYYSKHVDNFQHLERDKSGNTAIFRAITNNKPTAFISAMIQHREGLNILERNPANETPRDIADLLGKADLVEAINQYIFNNCSRGFLVNFPLNYYGKEVVKMCDKLGKTVLELAKEGGNQQDIQATEHYATLERQAKRLFEAARTGDVQRCAKLNTAIYKDKNGFTALTKAVVFNQPRVAEMLIAERPQLLLVPDNCNRYPLHYAYLMPAAEGGATMTRVLLQRNAKEIDEREDMHGKAPVDYQNLRGTREADIILERARNLDLYGRERESTFTTIASANTLDPYISSKEQTDLDTDAEI